MPPVLFCEVLFMSTIAAVATPDAVGGISVIRISGEKSLEIADKIFKNYAGSSCANSGCSENCFCHLQDGD